MLGRDEIKKRLEGIDHQLIVAFAARCSLRVFPLLVADLEREAFWYWGKEQRSKYILALLMAQKVSIYGVFTTTRANFAEAITFATTAFDVANTTTDADASKVAFAGTDDDATFAAISDRRAMIDLETEILMDLSTITNKTSFSPLSNKAKLISPTDFIYSPLWASSVPKNWRRLYARLNEALMDLDEGFELWVKWYKQRIDGKPLDKLQERIGLMIPAEITELGAKASNAYLANLLILYSDERRLKPLNLVRAIFIGNGAAGKTSLIRKLNGEPVVEGKEEMTAGVEIREWPVPDTEIKARFWDFGGQVMSHSTHQFFLRERCLYILVLDARTEFNANDQAEYWLEHVKAFGNNAPVMLVGNKTDLTAVNLDMNALQEKYSNIVDFYPVSCTNDESRFSHRFKIFYEDLTEQLTAVGTHQVMFAPNEFKVLEQVRQKARKNSFIEHQEFNDLCKQHDIGKKGLDQTAFLGLLDSLGEIIHFPDLQWSDAYVLNPRWLTYGVYTLLYANKADKQQGVLSHTDVVEILQAKKVEDEQGNQLTYPKDKCRFIIDAMSSFKLCYRLSEHDFVIPDKLPSEQPDLTAYFNKKEEGTLAFEFVFKGLLPRNIMPNLIVARHQEIRKDNEGKQLVWQHGVITYNATYHSMARLQVDYHDRTLQLWLQGSEAKEYLEVLRDEVYKILKAIKGLEVEENVILPEFARVKNEQFGLNRKEGEKAPYQRLLAEAKLG